MASTPQEVRREGEQAAECAEQVVRAAASEERTMAAIVLNDKQSHEHSGRWNRQNKSKPIRPRQTEIHQIPKSAEWQQRIQDLPSALEPVRTFKSREGATPTGVGRYSRVGDARLRRHVGLAL